MFRKLSISVVAGLLVPSVGYCGYPIGGASCMVGSSMEPLSFLVTVATGVLLGSVLNFACRSLSLSGEK